MSNVPEDLLDEIKHLEEMFTVDKAKLKQITEKFVKELAKGKDPLLILQWQATS